ncbi:LptF/LptG family permease [Candidatus Latescibacterota bacterium]
MRKLSKYILKEFTLYLFFCMLAFIVIFILVDTVENVDGFIDSSVHPKIIALYYIFFLPFIIVLTMPVAMLISAMFSLTRLVGDNEITAMKASGISLYRVLLPIYSFALIVGGIILVFSEIIVPRTNLVREDIQDYAKIKQYDDDVRLDISFSKKREMDRDNVFLANGDGRVINTLKYRSKMKKTEAVYIFEPMEGNDTREKTAYEEITGFRSRIDADSMTYRDGMWHLHNVTERVFGNDGEVQTTYAELPAPFITLKPSDFARIDVDPEEMNYLQLSRYINQVNLSGGDASKWLVDLHIKLSFPFVSFVIVFFGAPMAAGASKRGKTAAFGISLIILFFYYSLITGFQILGRNGAMEPIAAAWLPNGIFFTVGLLMHLRASK